MITSCAAAPTVGAIVCVAEAMPGALYVIVYVLPEKPLMPAPEKVATPLDIVAVAVPTTLAPRLTVIVTTEEESAAMLPLESIKFTRGCVVNAAPLAAPCRRCRGCR